MLEAVDNVLPVADPALGNPVGHIAQEVLVHLVHELGLLQEFLKLPHGKLQHVSAVVGTTSVRIADLTHLPTQCRYIALMPQWDFLNFLAEQGARYPAFDLRMKAEVTQLIEQDGRYVGLRAKTPTGELVITAALVVGADGRHSTVRERAGFAVAVSRASWGVKP